MCDVTLAVNLNRAFLKDLCVALGDYKAGVCAFYKKRLGDWPPRQSGPGSKFQAITPLPAIISRQ